MKLFNLYIILAVLGLGLSSCEKDFMKDGDPSFNGTFRPLALKATAIDGTPVTKVEFRTISGVSQYFLEISQDSLNFTNPALSDTIKADTAKGSVSLLVDRLAGNTRYYFRLRSISADAQLSDSKYANLVFRTPAENLFRNFMTYNGVVAPGSLAIRWTASSTVTDIQVVPDGGSASKSAISASEVLAGQKVVSNLQNNTNYTVNLLRGNDVRGSYRIRVEGDYFLNTGDDLNAAVSAASSGEVIVLAGDGTFMPTDGFTLKSGVDVTIKGGPGTQKATINLPGKELFKVTASTDINSVKIVNVNVTNASYLFNINAAGHLGRFSTDDCTFTNLTTAPIRLRSSFVVDSIVYNNCIFNNVGQNGYGLIMVDGSSKANDIVISNSTINSYGGCMVRYNSTTASNSLLITDCTTYNSFVGGNFVLRVEKGGVSAISISNSIFAYTKAAITAVSKDISYAVTNSFKTSDFDDSALPFTGVTTYSSASNVLFTDPASGNFKIKDNNFNGASTAGDPRWRL